MKNLGRLLNQEPTENDSKHSISIPPEYTLSSAALKHFQRLPDSHHVVKGEFEIERWCVVVKGECTKSMDILGKRMNIRYEEGAWLKPGIYKTIGAEVAVLVEDHPDDMDHGQMVEAVKQLYK